MAEVVERRSRSRGPWGYSDDSAMLLACAEALVAAGTIEPMELFRAFADVYEPARGFGRGMKIAIAAFNAGIPWDQCALKAWPEGSRGNGGAVRIPAVAAVRWRDAAAFDAAVYLATRTTHAHTDALSYARLQAVAIAVVLATPEVVDDLAAFQSAILARLSPAQTPMVEKLEQIFELAARDASVDDAVRSLGTSTLAAESVPAALWSFASKHRSFSEAVASAARLGGDVDSICSLVGALAGALHGAEAIDRQWIANLAGEQPSPIEILAIADRLHDLAPTSPDSMSAQACVGIAGYQGRPKLELDAMDPARFANKP